VAERRQADPVGLVDVALAELVVLDVARPVTPVLALGASGGG